MRDLGRDGFRLSSSESPLKLQAIVKVAAVFDQRPLEN